MALAAAEDRPGDGVEFGTAPSGDVLLHRALHPVGCGFSKFAQRLHVDPRALGAGDGEDLVLATALRWQD